MLSLRGRVLIIVATAALTTGTMMLCAATAGAVTCPTVARGTGTVTPAPAPGVDWSGCYLVGANLAAADLSGADLSRANLQRASLTGSNLSGATLASSTIDNADLAGTNLNGTTLAGIYTVVGVSSGGITGTPASMPGTELGATYLIDGYLAARACQAQSPVRYD